MGIFSRFGKTLKQNKLIDSSAARLYKNAGVPRGNIAGYVAIAEAGMPLSLIKEFVPNIDNAEDLVQIWTTLAVLSISATLQNIFFRQDEIAFANGGSLETNPFKKHSDKLTAEKSFEFFKLIGGALLCGFLHSQERKSEYGDWSVLEKMGFSSDAFKERIFSIFEFSNEDKAIYEELAKKRGEYSEEDSTKYFIAFYRGIAKKVYGMPVDERNIAVGVLWLSSILAGSYQMFASALGQETQDFRRRMISN